MAVGAPLPVVSSEYQHVHPAITAQLELSALTPLISTCAQKLKYSK